MPSTQKPRQYPFEGSAVVFVFVLSNFFYRVNGSEMIGLACFVDGFAKLRTVRLVLSLKAERPLRFALDSALEASSRHAVCCVKLHAGLVGVGRELVYSVFYSGSERKMSSANLANRRAAKDKVVVISGDFSAKLLANRAGGTEIERSSFYGEVLSARDKLAVDLADLVCVDGDDVVENSSVSGAADIEISVIGEIKRAFAIADCVVVDQKCRIGDRVGDLEIKVTWIVFFSVGRKKGKDDVTIVCLLDRPDLAIESDVAAVQMVLSVVVLGNLIINAANREASVLDSVCIASDERALAAIVVHVFVKRVVAADHIDTVFGKSTDDAAVCDNLKSERSGLQLVKIDFLSGRKSAEQ